MPYPSKLLQLASLATTVLAVDQQVDLPYTSYNGGAADDVSTWFGVRYAAPPTGNLRFQAPTPPLQEAGTQDATKVSSRTYSQIDIYLVNFLCANNWGSERTSLHLCGK